jgi:hypothetical protein
MFKVIAASLILASVANAQTVETVVRRGNTRSDVALRVNKSRLTGEVGSASVNDRVEVNAAGVLDLSANNLILVLEGQAAPNAYATSRNSYGASLGWKFGNLIPSTRLLRYNNSDGSAQTLASVTTEVVGPTVGGSVSVGNLTGIGFISQARLVLTSGPNTVILYASDNMEIPDVPWTVWVVKEAGVLTRLKLTRNATALVGYSAGSEYRAGHVGLKISK